MSLVVVVLAVSAILILNIGFFIQHKGVYMIFVKHTAAARLKNKDFWIWVLGTTIAAIGSLLMFYSISLGQVAIIQPLSGIGPVFLAFLSNFMTDNRLKSYEWGSIGLSTLGVIILSYVATTTTLPQNETFNETGLIVVSILTIIILLTTGLLVKYFLINSYGYIESFIAGILAGISRIYPKFAFPALMRLDLLHWSIYALIITQILGLIYQQKGFHLGNVAIVVSIFTAISIIFPVILALLFLNEQLTYLQVIGVVLIICAALVLSKRAGTMESKNVE